jgi:hypothetical protein
MQLDQQTLAIGDKVHHLLLGDGTIKTISQNSAIAIFGRQEMTVSAATIVQNGVKMIGLGKPIVFWPEVGYNGVSAYQLVNAASNILNPATP